MRNYVEDLRKLNVSLETSEYWELLCSLMDHEDQMGGEATGLHQHLGEEIKRIVIGLEGERIENL